MDTRNQTDKERQRQTHRQIDRQRQRLTEKDRQTDRQTETDRRRQNERQTDTDRDRERAETETRDSRHRERERDTSRERERRPGMRKHLLPRMSCPRQKQNEMDGRLRRELSVPERFGLSTRRNRRLSRDFHSIVVAALTIFCPAQWQKKSLRANQAWTGWL